MLLIVCCSTFALDTQLSSFLWCFWPIDTITFPVLEVNYRKQQKMINIWQSFQDCTWLKKKVWKESILLFESANYAKKGAIEFGIWRSLPVNVVIELWPNWLFWVFKLQQGVTCSFFLLDWYNFFKSENDHTAYYIRLKGTIVETKKIKWEHKCGRN